MSHVTDIKLRVQNLDDLEAACRAVGLELVRDQKTFAWWGTFAGDSHDYGEMLPSEMGHCAHAIRIPGTQPKTGPGGPWEIGVAKAKDGIGFGLFFDTFGQAGRALLDRVGVGATRLKIEYAAAAVARATAPKARQGWTTKRVERVGGGAQFRMVHR